VTGLPILGRESEVTRPSPWLFALAYTLHLMDEYLVPPGLPGFAVEQFNFYFTEQHWLIVNAISLAAFWGAVGLIARGTWPSWVLVALATHLCAHGTIHLVASVLVLSPSPGLASGVALSLTLCVWTLLWAARTLDRRDFVRAFAIGLVTFQAPWDFFVRLVFGLRWSAV
jgi:hypothetical protein